MAGARCAAFPPGLGADRSDAACALLLAPDRAAAAAAPAAPARVCRDVGGAGLHRELVTRISAELPLPRGNGEPRVSELAGSACELAVSHVLPRQLYFDLDAERAALRAHARHPACAAWAAAAMHTREPTIDVERPSFESEAHAVVTSVPLLVLQEGAGAGAPLPPLGCAAAAVAVLRPAPAAGPLGWQLHVTAATRHTLHARYPQPGCADGGSGVDFNASGDDSGDGTAWLTAPPGAWRWWLRGAPPTDATGPPFVSGCYSHPQLRLPAVHLRCWPLLPPSDADSRGGAAARPWWAPPAESAAAASGSGWLALSAGVSQPAESGGWLTLAPPGLATSACAPPLPPVPAAWLAAEAGVLLGTTLLTWGGALLVAAVVARARCRQWRVQVGVQGGVAAEEDAGGLGAAPAAACGAAEAGAARRGSARAGPAPLAAWVGVAAVKSHGLKLTRTSS